jgi:hypothetical protein
MRNHERKAMKRYPIDYERVVLTVPVGFKAAMEKLARRECRTMSAMIRWIAESRLREEGIPIEPGRGSE